MSIDASIYSTCPPHLGRGAPEDPYHVVEAWLAVPTPEGYLTLMLRRAPASGGFWQGVSGSVEPGDATYLDAAFRELAEETGFERARVKVLDLESTMVFRGPVSKRWFRKWCVGFVLPGGTQAADVELSEEHDEVQIMSFAAAAEIMIFEGQVSELERFARLLERA